MARRMLPVASRRWSLVAGLIWGVDGAISGGLRRRPRARQPGPVRRPARLGGPHQPGPAHGRRPRRLRPPAVPAHRRRAGRSRTSPGSTSPPLGLTLIVTHLGLLIWETRHVSASLAYPGLKPTAARRRAYVSAVLGALHFPPDQHLVEWRGIALQGHALRGQQGRPPDVGVGRSSCSLLFWSPAGPRPRPSLVPTGVQNVVESGVDFVRNDIILQTMGPAGLPWTPFLVTHVLLHLLHATSSRSSRSSSSR